MFCSHLMLKNRLVSGNKREHAAISVTKERVVGLLVGSPLSLASRVELLYSGSRACGGLTAAVGSVSDPPLSRGALAAASLRSRRRCAALWLENFSGLKTFLNLFFYHFFLAELTGRAPGKLNTTPKDSGP